MQISVPAAAGEEDGECELVFMPAIINGVAETIFQKGLAYFFKAAILVRLGLVAQLVEQRIENPCVGGSIPPRATKNVPSKNASPHRLAFFISGTENPWHRSILDVWFSCRIAFRFIPSSRRPPVPSNFFRL